MENFKPKQEQFKSMPCESVKKTIAELEKEGWEDAWSFHTRLTDQWNDACDKVTTLQEEGWDVVLVNDQDEAEKKDGVAYLYKKKKEA